MELSKVVTSERALSLEDFERLPEENDYVLELVRGRVVREPQPGALHGVVTSRLFRALDAHVTRPLGLVLVETGFLLFDDPPTVRRPDVAFLARERIPAEGVPEGFWREGPDLAVEVVSPGNRAGEIQEKALDYLAAGSGLVWVANPRARTITAYHSRDRIRVLVEGEELDGGAVLPGFRLALSEVFAPHA